MRAMRGSAASMLCSGLLIAAVLLLALSLLGFRSGTSEAFPILLILLCPVMHLFMHHGHGPPRLRETRTRRSAERSHDDAGIGSV